MHYTSESQAVTNETHHQIIEIFSLKDNFTQQIFVLEL